MSTAFIPTGINPSRKTPSVIVDVAFAQGEGSSADKSRSILLIGMKTSDGSHSFTTDGYSPIELRNESDAASIFGARSEIRRMYRRIAQVNPSAQVFATVALEPTGAKATGTITLTGTATGSGTITCDIADETVYVGYSSGDTATVVGDALAAAINAIAYLPLTAANVTGTITLTTALKGAVGNEICYRAVATSGKGISVTTAAAKLASGSGVAVLTSALSAIATSRYYYQVSSAVDSTAVQALTLQIENLASPTYQIKQVGVFGSVDTIANAITLCSNSAVNSPRMQCVSLYNSAVPSCELAAMVAGKRAYYEISDPSHNLNGLSLPIRAPYARADWQTALQNEVGLAGGVAVLGISSNGSVSLISSRTTQSKNKVVGTENDYRAAKTLIVSVSDAFADDLRSDCIASFAGKKVSADTKQAQPENVVQPKHLRAKIIKWLKDYTSSVQLSADKLDDSISSVIVAKTTGTLSAQVRIYCAEDLDQVWVNAKESSNPQ